MRVTFGIDPGLSGAVAVLVDGEPVRVYDMPTRKVGDWGEVDAQQLAFILREERARYPGASFSASIEKVGARPNDGATSAFRFGESSGKAKAVLEALGIPYSRAIPAVWKRHYGLIGQDKDAGRVLAIARFPAMADQLNRKKDDGRADALLLALWHDTLNTHGVAA